MSQHILRAISHVFTVMHFKLDVYQLPLSQGGADIFHAKFSIYQPKKASWLELHLKMTWFGSNLRRSVYRECNLC